MFPFPDQMRRSSAAPVGALAEPDGEESMGLGATVFVIDTDAETCDAIRDVAGTMNFGCEVYASAQAFLEAYHPSRPGCLVSELRVPGMSGLQLQRRLRERYPRLPIVFLASYTDVSMAVETMRMGAIHFLQKPVRTHELWTALQEALQVDRERREANAWREEFNQRLADLTPKEREILKLLGQGQSGREIAAATGVCVRTVEVRRANLIRKLGVSSLTELLDIAILAASDDAEDFPPGHIDWLEG